MFFTDMVNKATEKIKSQSAMSLTEVLVAVLLLSLATGIIAVCFSLSTKLFIREKRVSQSQMLLDALTVSVQDELRYATSIQEDSEGSWFSYCSRNRAGQKNCRLVSKADESKEQHIMIDGGTGKYELVSDEFYQGLDAYIERDPDAAKTWDGQFFHLRIEIKVKGTDECVASKTFEVEALNAEYNTSVLPTDPAKYEE